MDLPNHFIADMNPAPELTPDMIWEACLSLKRNRENILQHYNTRQVINIISETAARWLQPEDPFRKLALDQGPEATGFSRNNLAEGLDIFFKSITPHALENLIQQELGHLDRLDNLISSEPEQLSHRASMVSSPELLTHYTAGNLPCPAMMSMFLGLLLRSSQFIKCASGSSYLPRLLAHSIQRVDSHMAGCMELVEWPGGERSDLEEVLFRESGRITATGSNEMLLSLKQRIPANRPLVGYGHKVSFAFVARGCQASYQITELTRKVAEDLTLWDQLGCLSPHVIYLEQDHSGPGALGFAEALAEALTQREITHPRGPVSVETSASIRSKREFYQIRADHSEDTRMWQSDRSTAWTVVYEANPLFQLSSLHRFVYVKPAPSLEDVIQQADAIRDKVSTVGLAAPSHHARDLAKLLGKWGATRVCPIGQMQKPPLQWRHDGRPSLSDLLQWTDWEMDGTH